MLKEKIEGSPVLWTCKIQAYDFYGQKLHFLVSQDQK